MSRYYRATRPLNEDAVAAANAAVAGSTGGRPLTMGPEDADLRNTWMIAYMKAGGKAERVDANAAGDCTDPKKKCPCQPITSIKLLSVNFLSDHVLLKNEETAWTNTGTKFLSPEWDHTGRSSPISHTMDKELKVTVRMLVEPENACPEAGNLFGATGEADGIDFFDGTVTFKPGVNSYNLTSTNKFPRRVDQFGLLIDWVAQAQSTSGGGKSENDCYLTIDTPIDSGMNAYGVTLKRMAKAVELVMQASSLDPHEIVTYLMSLLPAYTLEVSPNVPPGHRHPTYLGNTVGGAWPIADYLTDLAECQAIVRFVTKILKQVGCPGQTETVVVWTDPDVEGGRKVLEKPFGATTLHEKRKVVGGETWYPALAATNSISVGAIFPAKSSVMNMYEACLKFTYGGKTYYYGGGAGRYDNKDEVIHAFKALVWYAPIFNPGGNVDYIVREVVQTY